MFNGFSGSGFIFVNKECINGWTIVMVEYLDAERCIVASKKGLRTDTISVKWSSSFRVKTRWPNLEYSGRARSAFNA